MNLLSDNARLDSHHYAPSGAHTGELSSYRWRRCGHSYKFWIALARRLEPDAQHGCANGVGTRGELIVGHAPVLCRRHSLEILRDSLNALGHLSRLGDARMVQSNA